MKIKLSRTWNLQNIPQSFIHKYPRLCVNFNEQNAQSFNFPVQLAFSQDEQHPHPRAWRFVPKIHSLYETIQSFHSQETIWKRKKKKLLFFPSKNRRARNVLARTVTTWMRVGNFLCRKIFFLSFSSISSAREKWIWESHWNQHNSSRSEVFVYLEFFGDNFEWNNEDDKRKREDEHFPHFPMENSSLMMSWRWKIFTALFLIKISVFMFLCDRRRQTHSSSNNFISNMTNRIRYHRKFTVSLSKYEGDNLALELARLRICGHRKY